MAIAAHTEALSIAAEQAIALTKDEAIRGAIARMAKAYRDAISVYELAENRATNPLASSYTAADRERNVRQIKELKDQLYKEYDDPIARDRLRGQIDLIEALMRNRAARGNEEEDPVAKKVREQKIDASAKLLLEPYGLQDEWPEKRWDLTKELLDVGVKILASIRDCMKQAEPCPALLSHVQLRPTTSTLARTVDPLIGSWKLDFVAGNTPVTGTFNILRQNDTYTGMFRDASGSTSFDAISVSGNKLFVRIECSS